MLTHLSCFAGTGIIRILHDYRILISDPSKGVVLVSVISKYMENYRIYLLHGLNVSILLLLDYNRSLLLRNFT